MPSISRTATTVSRLTKPESDTTETVCTFPAESSNRAVPPGRRSVRATPRAPIRGTFSDGSMFVKLPAIAVAELPTLVLRIKGSDLALYDADRTRKAEVRQRVETREF